MTETTLRRATDSACYIKWADHSPFFVVWSGGTTYNVYHSHSEGVAEVDVFTVSDDKGRPLDFEAARERVEAHLAEMEPSAVSDSKSGGLSYEEAHEQELDWG